MVSGAWIGVLKGLLIILATLLHTSAALRVFVAHREQQRFRALSADPGALALRLGASAR
ncbi:MAG: hypothetical protein QME77_00655 [bacterium]|nr:hypothetical protein [bacterium]